MPQVLNPMFGEEKLGKKPEAGSGSLLSEHEMCQSPSDFLIFLISSWSNSFSISRVPHFQ